MIKKYFLYKSGLANKLSSIGVGLFVVCLCLLSGSCDSNIFPGDDDSGGTAPVALQFSTSVEKLLSTTDTRAASNSNGRILQDGNFPEGESEIGMFITKNSFGKESEVFPGSKKNMKAVLIRTSGTESWTYPSGVTPTGNVGTNIKVVAYWPYDSGATVSGGIPFDFTDITNTGQTDLLYNKKENQEVKIQENEKIPLQFAHAYSWISLYIYKSVTSTRVSVSSASIINQTGSWIKHKGWIDPTRGFPTGNSIPGAITDATGKDALLEPNAKTAQYNFLVPPFMNHAVTDGSVAFKLVVEGKETVFSLERKHLNKTDDGKYGFQQGFKNSYVLIYDNLTASLQLRDWNTVELEGGNIGEPLMPDASYKGWLFNYNDISKQFVTGLKDPIGTHEYETYYTDHERGNNGSWAVIWDEKSQEKSFRAAWDVEPPRSPIEFALNDATSTPVQWRDQSQRMVAKELCRNYREGGYTNWRLPRISEWYMFERRIQTENDYLYFPRNNGGQLPGQYWYWSGTQETQKNNPLAIQLAISENDVQIKGTAVSALSTAMVRCVRDVDSGTN